MGQMAFRRKPVTWALFFFYLLLVPTQLIAARKTLKIKGPIKTVVVVVMENRSFDHIFGWLKSTRPDIDGLNGNESNPISISKPGSPRVRVSSDAFFVDSDPGHSFQAIREQIFGSNESSKNPAPMNGFAQQAESMGEGMARTVMSGFKPEVLPVYTELANEFAVFDRWFASVPASTQPNRFYVHSATSHGAMSNVRKDLIHGFPQKTIFDSLDENGLDFGIYYQNIPATLFFKSLRKLKQVLKFHSYALTFKLHARLGKLPNYAVIEQRYFDVKELPANDDHPSHDVARGQRFVKEVYETLRASPQWKEMALLITYDEHGGFYDHVPTPVSGVPSPDGIEGPDPFYFRFDRLGVRVPTILVSPWVEKGTVIHEPTGPTPHSQFEHSSISATVKKLFNLKSNFLTKRDAWAGTFENYFTVRSTPRDDCPETLPEVTTSLRPGGPREDLSLSEFQVELIQLASQLNGDHVLNTYPKIGETMTVREANSYAEDAVKRFLEAGRAALNAGANESAIVTMRPSLTSRANAQVIHEPTGPTPHSQSEHSSIPATVKKVFNLKSSFLTKRDAWAGTFENYFTFRSTPRDDCPETLPEVTTSLRPGGPREDSSLSEFQVELIQLASQLNGDHVLNTYPNIGETMTVREANSYAEDAVKRFLEAGRAAAKAGANESAIVTMRPSLTSRVNAPVHNSYLESQ